MNRKPLKKITDEDIATYNEKGVVCLRQMFDKDWIERMHAASFDYMDQDKGNHRKREATLSIYKIGRETGYEGTFGMLE